MKLLKLLKQIKINLEKGELDFLYGDGEGEREELKRERQKRIYEIYNLLLNEEIKIRTK